jgi:ABC-type branched-subunit amino acid transport system permease subunit
VSSRVPIRGLLAAVGVVILGVFPLVFSNPNTTSIAFFTLIFMVSASAWNMFAGNSGYIALGHAVYFGCGAYALTLLAISGSPRAGACSRWCRWPGSSPG